MNSQLRCSVAHVLRPIPQRWSVEDPTPPTIEHPDLRPLTARATCRFQRSVEPGVQPPTSYPNWHRPHLLLLTKSAYFPPRGVFPQATATWRSIPHLRFQAVRVVPRPQPHQPIWPPQVLKLAWCSCHDQFPDQRSMLPVRYVAQRPILRPRFLHLFQCGLEPAPDSKPLDRSKVEFARLPGWRSSRGRQIDLTTGLRLVLQIL